MRSYRKRQILRLPHFTEDERFEIEHDYTWKPHKCPVCNGKISYASWSEEYHGIVETLYKCGCGYYNSWSYGITELEVGNWRKTFGHELPDHEVDEILDEFDRQVIKQKKKMKRIMKRIYKTR